MCSFFTLKSAWSLIHILILMSFFNFILTPDAKSMDLIERAIDEYARRTCIRFRPRTYERDYISFTNEPTGCWSSVGRIGGKQVN